MILFAQDPSLITINLIVVCIVAIVVMLVVFAIFINYFRWWIQSVTTGAGVSMLDLIGMRFRKVNPNVILRSKVMAVQAGLDERSTGITS